MWEYILSISPRLLVSIIIMVALSIVMCIRSTRKLVRKQEEIRKDIITKVKEDLDNK